MHQHRKQSAVKMLVLRLLSYPEPRNAAQHHHHHFCVSLFKPDAFQLTHGGLQQGVDLHGCHGVFVAIRGLLVLHKVTLCMSVLPYTQMYTDATGNSVMHAQHTAPCSTAGTDIDQSIKLLNDT